MNGWSPAAGPDLASVTQRLHESELSIVGRLPWSSNLTFLVALEDSGGGSGRPEDSDASGGSGASGGSEVSGGSGGDSGSGGSGASGGDSGPGISGGSEQSGGSDGDGASLYGVYKPATGEQSLWDFPGGLYRREVAAYVLSEALGWDLVPPTVERHDGPFGSGSLQLFVAADYEEHYFTLFDQGDHVETLQTMCAFDIVANNADRKSGHVLLGNDGRLWGIDHGLCFHRQPKLRTVIWDFADEPVPGRLLEDLDRLARDLPHELERLLDDDERSAIIDRIARLVHTATFPEPLGDRPPYPWPLV